MKIGLKNGLKPKDINFTDKYIKNNFNASKTYKETINGKTTDLTARVEGSKKLTNPNTKKTIIEVMESKELNLTDHNLLKKHKEIREKAIKINQLSTAEKANSRFMEIKGILSKENPQGNTNIANILSINIDKTEAEDIKNSLLEAFNKKK